MVLGREDVEHGTVGGGGAVPDGLHPGDISSYLQKCDRPGPTAQLVPLYGPRSPPQRPPEVTHRVLQSAHAYPPPASDHPDEGGRTLCGPTEGYPKTKGLGFQEERVGFVGHVEACQQEIIHVPGSIKRPCPHPTPRPCNQHEPEGGQATADGVSGRGDRADNGRIPPPPPQGIMSPDEGVVQVCG